MPPPSVQNPVKIPAPTISVLIVTHNSADHLPACLAALAQQQLGPTEILLLDNASNDDSAAIARSSGVRVLESERNIGLSAALNRGLQASAGEYALCLNPDVVLESNYLLETSRLMSDPSVAAVQGRLLRPDKHVLDSAGIALKRSRRPHDRGFDEPEHGQYAKTEAVGAVCGAAALYRRAALLDIAIGEEVWDEDFFMYFEDIDLAWRMWGRGWSCRYTPHAAAIHDRGLAETLRRRKRAEADAAIQRRAIVNRYLMLLKNETWASLLPDLPWLLGSDSARWGYIMLRRPDLWPWPRQLRREWPLAQQKRRQILARRKMPDRKLRRRLLMLPEKG